MPIGTILLIILVLLLIGALPTWGQRLLGLWSLWNPGAYCRRAPLCLSSSAGFEAQGMSA